MRFRNFLNWYSKYLTKYPKTTNSTTGFIIAFIGDILCQEYENSVRHKKAIKTNESIKNVDIKQIREEEVINKLDKLDTYIDIDFGRSLKMGLIRSLLLAPFLTIWYPFINRLSPHRTIPGIIKRICLDQGLGAPMIISLVFIPNAMIYTILSSKNEFTKENFKLSTIPKVIYDGIYNGIMRLYTQGGKTWLGSIQFWPFVHMITFTVIPQAHQPLFAHFASLYWNALLSYYSNKTDSDKKIVVNKDELAISHLKANKSLL